MLRSDIVNIVNRIAQDDETCTIQLLKTYDIIFDYCRNTKTKPKNNKYQLINGALYINDKFIRRVAQLPQKADFSEYTSYLEGKLINDICD